MSASLHGHYATEGIADRLLAALRAEKGADVAITPDTLAPLDQFHGRGIAATEEVVRLLAPQPGDHVVDIGCGIGGPARWIASRFACDITGVDLTDAFCTAAVALNQATGLHHRIRILHGSATALPLPDAVADRAYSQNVLMNIADKDLMYREAFRVLKPGGSLVLSTYLEGAGPLRFPVPWASLPEQSHLTAEPAMRAGLAAAGFEILAFNRLTPEQRGNPRAALARIDAGAIPPLGLQVLMGPRFVEMMRNSMHAAAEGLTEAVDILARKPAAPPTP